MTRLGRFQLTQQFTAAGHNDPSLLSRKRLPLCQPAVNGFAGADEIQDLFANRTHGERSLGIERHGVREGRRSAFYKKTHLLYVI